ncbi:hypothetical protein [Stygiolobus caldivivus]|uniref:5,10-methylenetetrahydrofolate reductase n=1 Tax=Stygiolobus caldivivus TaxID=2824673 RepID=A0A8D5U6W0_9CREN|nr:hypothetical protein [Stygiolobus caldivivus]BCU70317.1 hypothetical protein KN1_16140 [Stygiolobus caldivivus]
MQILVEVHPKHKLEKLVKTISLLEPFDGFDVPDSPLGLPSPLASVVGTLIRQTLRDDKKRVIINQRTLDINELFIHSLSVTSKMMGFDVTFTRGDKPKIGKEVGYVSPEDAVRIAKGYGVMSGLMLSMRKNKEEIEERIRNGNADFYLVLRLEDPEQLNRLNTSLMIPYVIVKTEKNKEVASTLNQPTIEAEKAIDFIMSLKEKGINNVLLSALGDYETLLQILKKI